MSTFAKEDYGHSIHSLLAENRIMPLGPGKPNEAARSKIENLKDGTFFQTAIHDHAMVDCCRAALWLYHDFLEESHTISQEIETTTGSYWHGFLHRREPDFRNAEYWFRRVGDHSIFKPLCQAAAKIAASFPSDGSSAFLSKQSAWDPFAFVRLCEDAYTGSSPHEMLCCQIQQTEWKLLFNHSYKMAIQAA